ncbi:hypothetical protein K469DRAFT_706282 [Zopfia rhizophila CBS 207.26]|uniref:Autophagy-related protein 27 n=1 Tax=Zopfia rhizophila CBS 207.26 TaxID=1314779 RepID=A0A6A6ET88_9PEZI|nr:hypothetical protein K469DRAFT_706282 [Zopfia rhizophila CBS 207.26]
MRAHTPSGSSRSISSSTLSLSTLSTLLFAFPSLIAGFDCEDIAAQGQHFNFGPLSGAHQVHWLHHDNVSGVHNNYTFAIDICKNLKSTECPKGTRICGINHRTDLEKGNITTHYVPIAGTYTLNSGTEIDARFSLLRNSKSHSDAGREGVRAELHGGRYPFKKGGMPQQAIIEFVCDKERTGLEGDEKDEGGEGDDGKDKKEEGREKKLRRRDDKGCEDSNKSLRFCGYTYEEEKDKTIGVLRLDWRTKYACEDAVDEISDGHWGFFTWFIIILFLATASYLIFGSWLNYNRYGARGWDLLPHGDTIRDIPYILKDWARRVANTVQGPGSRGGYSAV